MPLPTPRPAPVTMMTLSATVCIAFAESVTHAPSFVSAPSRHATVPAMSGDLDGTGGARSPEPAAASARRPRSRWRGRGGSVLGLDRTSAGLAETAALVAADGRCRSSTAAGDVGDEDAVAEAVARAVGAFGRLDGVVTCAGIFAGDDLQPLENVELDTFLQRAPREPRGHVPRGQARAAAPRARRRRAERAAS